MWGGQGNEGGDMARTGRAIGSGPANHKKVHARGGKHEIQHARFLVRVEQVPLVDSWDVQESIALFSNEGKKGSDSLNSLPEMRRVGSGLWCGG